MKLSSIVVLNYVYETRYIIFDDAIEFVAINNLYVNNTSQMAICNQNAYFPCN